MNAWEKFGRRTAALTVLSFSMLSLSSFGGQGNGTRSNAKPDKQNENDVVYVCACPENQIVFLHDYGKDGRRLRVWLERRSGAKGSARQ